MIHLVFVVLTMMVFLGEGNLQADEVASSCRSVGQEFSVGGVPGLDGWPKEKINCCPGLTDRERREDYDDQCQNQLAGGYYGRCVACGDGQCDEKFESKCNCPEDCVQ